ncbi:MAG: hypothetical protein QXJ74_02760 [Nitrososphaera sp.]|uniref:hypothetical protein n=1 Tax=Nitrososphaera sp. TaxID=1971748 RepID=UPI00317E65CD
MKVFVFVLVAMLASAALLQPAFAEGMRQASSGNSLDILVEPRWDQDRMADLKVSFLQPGTDTIQVHVDFDVKVVDSGGNQVFSAAGLLGFPTLHTAEGVVEIPYRFEEDGSYTLVVDVTGIQFAPIAQETAEFSVNVTPEFPAGAMAATVAAVAGAISAARLKRLLPSHL